MNNHELGVLIMNDRHTVREMEKVAREIQQLMDADRYSETNQKYFRFYRYEQLPAKLGVIADTFIKTYYPKCELSYALHEEIVLYYEAACAAGDYR